MQVVAWHEGAMRRLRERMEQAEADRGELLAFARGHAGAADAIHQAVLTLLPARSAEELVAIVTGGWPCLLGVDACAIGWSIDGEGFVADMRGRAPCDPRLVERMADLGDPVVARVGVRGHPLFGAAAREIGAEVLVRMESVRGLGLLALGQSGGGAAITPAGAALLRFLGQTLALMLERCRRP